MDILALFLLNWSKITEALISLGVFGTGHSSVMEQVATKTLALN